MKYLKQKVFIFFFIFLSNGLFAQSFTKHFVETGETLTFLSKKYGVTIEDILFANQDILENENELELGMILKIPEKPYASANPQKSYPYGTLHLIKTGEYLSNIASQYEGVKIGDIMKYNNIHSVDATIQRGRILLIPPPNGKSIQWNKIENLELLEMVGNIDNPYLMPEYMEYLLPEGEDPLHDLARDYYEDSQENQEKVLKEQVKTVEDFNIPAKKETPKQNQTEKRVLRGVDKTTQEQETEENDNVWDGEVKTKILQKGKAITFKTNVDKNYFWLKHRTAPVGIVVWIINPLNNKKVQARVTEKLDKESEYLAEISPAISEVLEIIAFPCDIQTEYSPE